MAEAPAAMLAVLEAPGVKGREVLRLAPPRYAPNEKDAVTSLIRRIVAAPGNDHPPVTRAFNVLDIGKVAELFAPWRHGLKGVTPYYAVKCNPNPALLGALSALGSGFDCASPAEMDAVLALGNVSPDRIVYANPCKPESHITYAASLGVNVTTFDSVEEVGKMKRFHPTCKLLLRLKVSGAGGEAVLDLGTKYGAREEDVAPLLCAARDAGMQVCGVAFHVGCKVSRVDVYDDALKAAREVFDAAVVLGLPPMRILDIGGGFTAAAGGLFEEACGVINVALARHFGDIMPGDGVEVIGEPGHYFAETPFTLAARVFGKRTHGQEEREYWIDDGIYGTLSCVINVYKYKPRPVPMAAAAPADDGSGGETTHLSTVFGPTLDSLDVVVQGYPLPELRIGDWLVFHDVGAYTTVMSCNFNGFSASEMKTYLASSA
ncbi:hypothetical protein HU200_016770 [Digitaria exilis]|uniref:ornithine decarboxylase n=1 Tax=Digitaria exilis TaxID=1010633 RepID=A0A835KI55_9POAL|nr:hypothetical protein HU200_016770 [Digitaria exilis]CAB3491184.1 unnamed protein product [Digitaria exilis]